MTVNPLAPGEEQTVCVMQQAPHYVSSTAQDVWVLVFSKRSVPCGYFVQQKKNSRGEETRRKPQQLDQWRQQANLVAAEQNSTRVLHPNRSKTPWCQKLKPFFFFFLSVQEAWCEDEWALVGEGLDFVNEAEARSKSPHITVIPRSVGGPGANSAEDDSGRPSLANTVFVAASRHRRGSSQYQSQPQSLSLNQYLRHSGHHGPSYHSSF